MLFSRRARWGGNSGALPPGGGQVGAAGPAASQRGSGVLSRHPRQGRLAPRHTLHLGGHHRPFLFRSHPVLFFFETHGLEHDRRTSINKANTIRHAFLVSLALAPLSSLLLSPLANIGKYSICHTERRKAKREGRRKPVSICKLTLWSHLQERLLDISVKLGA